MHTDDVRIQKSRYLELNPVRWGLSETPSDYKWSSSKLFELGLNDSEGAIDLAKGRDFYRNLLSEQLQ